MSKREKEGMESDILRLWKNMKLKNKLLISTTMIITIITLSILFSANRVITKNMLKNKEEMVSHTVVSVENLLNERQRTLEKYTSFILRDKGFIDTVNASILNHNYSEILKQTLGIQKEINVERIAVYQPGVGNQCKVLAYTSGERKPGELINTHRLCREAEGKGISSELMVENGQFDIKICSGIKKKDRVVAYLMIDDILGHDLVEQIKASTGAELAFLMYKGNNTGRVVASAHKNMVGEEINSEAYTRMLSTSKTTYQSNFIREGEIHMVAFTPLLDKNNAMMGSMMILVHMDDIIKVKANTLRAMTSIGFFAIAIGILAIILLVRSAINPMRQLLFSVEGIGKGDLTRTIDISGTDEVGQLSSAFVQMQERLLDMVKQIKSSVELLESFSVELSTSGREQADGSMQQSSALTETSTTVEELAATSKQIAENAQTVAELARQSLSGMENIRNNTDQEANRILTLGEKSQTIGEVVAMIDDIAKQTNILALNASIEAERAGEAGKGFAVVAIEIRELATNVAKSTKQIREIIKEIQDATNASVMATENVGKSVAEGIELSKQAADSANQISMATQQQGNASEEVVAAIKQMSDIVGQTTAGANQIADTAHQLVQLTADQKKLVEQFIIK